MCNLNATPFVAKVLSNKTPMTVMGLVLAAEETGIIEEFWVEFFFDLSGSHEVTKSLLVGFPRPLMLLVCVEYILSGGEFGKMHVVNLSNCTQEISERSEERRVGERV